MEKEMVKKVAKDVVSCMVNYGDPQREVEVFTGRGELFTGKGGRAGNSQESAITR